MDTTQTTGMPVAPKENGSKKLWVIGLIVLALLVGGYFLMGTKTPDDLEGIVVGDDNNIMVNEQNADSVAVLVESVSVRAPGFIAIRENDNGKVGRIIGVSRLLTPGTYANVSTIAPIKPGTSYFATLLADDGNGLFDANTDTVYLKNADGKDVVKEFKVSASTIGGEDKG